MKNPSFRWFILLLAFSNTLFLQAQVSDEKRMRDEEKLRQDTQRASEKQQIDRVQGSGNMRPIESDTRRGGSASILREFENRTLTKREREELESLRSPNSEDITKYREFLKQKRTGIFRLFPNLGCEQGRILRVDGDCANAVLNSWSYSFQNKDYGEGDLKLDTQSLISDSFLSQNIIVGLGDVPLENVSLGLNQAKFLLDFKPEAKNKKAREQFWQISKKITVNNFIYGKVIRTDENATFLMRIIAYRLSIIRFPEFFNKKRRDKIIAFRIIRKDSDDSITILWKELADKKSPKLEFEKGEEFKDFQEK